MSSLLKVQTCWSYLLSTWHLTWVNARVYYVYYVHFSHLFPKHNICLIVNMICTFAWRRDPEMSVTRETLPHPQGIHVLDSLTMTMARIISMTTTTHRVHNCDVNHPIVKRICILEPWSVTCDNLPFLWKLVSLQTKKCPREPVSNQPAVPSPKCPIVKLLTVWSDHIAISLLNMIWTCEENADMRKIEESYVGKQEAALLQFHIFPKQTWLQTKESWPMPDHSFDWATWPAAIERDVGDTPWKPNPENPM